MGDPVSILISLAPFILDLLFGKGHSMKHRKINPRYNKMDKAMLMSGGAYPRRRDYTDDEKYNETYAKEYAKYAVRSATNPWVLFLEKSGFYDRLKEDIDRLRDEYEQMKKDAGFVEVKKEDVNPRIANALTLKKTRQLDKFKAAKYVLDQISNPKPNPIRDEFEKLTKREYEKALKMGFTEDDIHAAYGRIFSKLVRAIESAESDLKKYESKANPPPPPPPEAAVAKGYGRVSYKTMAKELARKHEFRLPRSARQHGKTWKGIYMDLTTGLK
jgi:hypothetical protein